MAKLKANLESEDPNIPNAIADSMHVFGESGFLAVALCGCVARDREHYDILIEELKTVARRLMTTEVEEHWNAALKQREADRRPA